MVIAVQGYRCPKIELSKYIAVHGYSCPRIDLSKYIAVHRYSCPRIDLSKIISSPRIVYISFHGMSLISCHTKCV